MAKKEKYLQIFNYLLEFSKLRSNSVRDIDISETQYPEKFWLNDIPLNELFENILRPEFNKENDYWIKIRKPKEPEKPTFAILPKKLQLWVEPSSLFNEENEPTIKDSIEVDGEILMLKDFSEISDEFKKYVNGKWIDDLVDYISKFKEYQEGFEIYEKLNDTYKKLFRIHNKAQQFGEEYELIVGVGLLNFKEDTEKPKIFRHIITQKVDINFEYSQKESQIYINPNIESSPQIETDSIIDLYQQFDSQNIIDTEKIVDAYIKEKGIDQLFFDNLILDALQIFADRVSPDGKFLNTIEKPTTTPNRPTIYFSPALLLRKRNTRSFTALYEKILENIENGGDKIEIPSIDVLIGVQEKLINDTANPEISNLEISANEPIFFPKEYNNEQIEIIEKAKRNNKVLVQGPPGTGKSHTIANLICHLLANGKKVLVTAHTPRALKVLKDKLPEEFQNLTVNLLSGDSSSLQDLQKSVNAINDELSRANLSEYQRDIERFTKELSELRGEIAHNTNELIKIKEKTTRKQEINPIYIGTLTEIAEKLESDLAHYEWYKDSFDDIKNENIINELQKYIGLNNKYNHVDISEFNYSLPNIENLPTVDQVKQYKKTAKDLLSHNPEKAGHVLIKCNDYNELKSMLIKLDEFYKEADNLQIDFTDKLIASFLQRNANQWHEKVKSSSQIINRLEKFNLKQIDRDVEITYNSDNSLKQLKSDAQRLSDYLNQGNSLEGISFALKKPFLSRELKESLYFIESIRVNGSPCDKIEEFKSVIDDIELQQDFEEISQLWDSKIPKGKSYFDKFSFFKNINSEVSKLIKIIQESEQLCTNIETFAGVEVNSFDKPSVNKLINECEYNHLLKTVEEFKEVIKKAVIHLNQDNIHPIAKNILINFRDIDDHSYKQNLENLQSFAQRKKEYREFRDLQAQIQNILPNLTEDILAGKFTNENLQNLVKAFHFLHAKNEIHQLMDVNYEQKILSDLKEFEKKEKKFIAKLASKKAWGKVIEGLQQNRTLRQHLEAWVQAVKKIGKTGKGKRALKFRKEAQEQMEKCKNSVPCWIMPLYKVAETINPEQEMYDYVIIDEASQLGPDAIFLLYISKNIIIVGDDKQTSPEYVGVDANTMTPHINRHLEGIPFSNYYGTEFSFFDHAKRFCDGTTLLREHFRCMPEIIEFSNKHFYAPEGKGLYPLKQYSENRLEPLKTVFCQNGYKEGDGAKIINEPEAKQLVETIARLIEDERYNGKTFGVIGLQGNQQYAIIENLLLKRIGEAEFHKRKIVCGNSASFQGDERDIIFLSLVTAHNHNRSALTKPEDERRFNVAVSRAIEQIWLFHSIEMDDLSNTNDLRYKLLDHFKNPNSTPTPLTESIKRGLGTQPEPFDSWFEVDVYNDIVGKG
ncbi:MAG: AAA domain-containing protein, partial [Caldisericia bacterium]